MRLRRSGPGSRAGQIARAYANGELRPLAHEEQYRNAARKLPAAYQVRPQRLHPTQAWKDLAGRTHVVLAGGKRPVIVSFWTRDLELLQLFNKVRTLSPDPSVRPKRFVELTQMGQIPAQWVRMILHGAEK